MASNTTEINPSHHLSSSEASAAEIISKMSEYQFIAVVQDGNTCEPMEQVVNEKGEVVAINTNEYYETIGEAVELNFQGMNEEIKSNDEVNEEAINELAIAETIKGMKEEIQNVGSSSSQDQVVATSVTEGDDGGQDHHNNLATTSDLKDMLVPVDRFNVSLGIELPDHKLQQINKKKRPKSSLFIGCSADAVKVINEFESLKETLSVKSNLEMLQYLLKLVKKELESTVVTTECMVDNGRKNTKAILQLLSAPNDVDTLNQNESEIETTGNEEVTINIVNGQVMERNEQQQDMAELLGLTALNVKTIQLSKRYLEHIMKDGFYISGFIDNSEKLDEFLKFFRIITGSAFSIRRSKSKINDDPEPEEKPLRKYKPGYLGKGQIKWEKNIGIPPIPFTGVPFTTEGSTTYQCIYGPKRAKAAHQKENTEDEESLEPVQKRRKSTRESKKKDCPAQIHIRTVHRFPTYNCISSLPPIKTNSTTTYVNKCQRGIILAKLREDIVNEKVHGEQGFWIRVPLPEVHQNHSLGPFDGDDPPLTEDTLLEMKALLHNAAITS